GASGDCSSDVCSSELWWGFKEEAMDGIQQNAALNQQAGGRPLIHSDSPSGIQRLNQEAAKAMYAGQRAGIPITRDQALRWITVKDRRSAEGERHVGRR